MDITNFNKSPTTTTAIGQILPNTVGLDTVRALHQTVVSLRAALENSQVELSRLRDKIKHRTEYRDAIERLSIENHILRRKIIQNGDQIITENQNHQSDEQICMAGKNEFANLDRTISHEEVVTTTSSARLNENEFNSIIPIIELPENVDSEKSLQIQNNQSKSNLSIERDLENLSLKSFSEGDNSVFSDNENVQQSGGNKNDSENESEEVDDIELIFTTEETKELGTLQEDLVSITEPEQSKESDTDTPVLINYKSVDFDSGDINGGDGGGGTTTENSDDDVFVMENMKQSKNSLDVGDGSDICKQRSIESQDSFIDSNKSFEKDESFDQFDEKEKKLQKMWSQCSVLVETDISKCGVLDDSEMPNLASRRNTCPNPLAYRPVIYRDNFMKTPIQTAGGRNTKYIRNTGRNSFTSSSIRPILNEKCALKTESEAQTDISALPCPWKSESYLAHKVAHTFTTLPSKFALPIYQQPKMRLSEKTQEARRVLLSDINFTSMVPELSRSADHLCQEEIENIPPMSYQTRGQYLRTPETHRKYDATEILTSPNFGKYYSPSDYSNFGSSRFDSSLHGMNRYRGSLTSITSPSQYDIGRQSSYWRQHVPQSFDNSTRGTRFSYSSRPTFGSVPTSPTRHHRSRSVPHVQRSIDSTSSRYSFGRSYSRPTSQWGFGQRNKTRSRVTFEDTNLRCNSRTNHSLPDLRSDSYDSGGDSTDSLVEEAEHYLRRSIDCMVSGGPMGHTCEDWKTERSRVRRASAPDPVRETDPPAGSTPYLPRIPRDLRLGHWVKVIGPEGRVRGGRVRHVGVLIDDNSSLTQNTAYIGVELATPTGNSDGSYQGKRFFDCEPDHAIFVPFKKVIMAWNT